MIHVAKVLAFGGAVFLLVSLITRCALAAGDPVTAATSGVDSLAALVTTYGWTVGGVVLAYALTKQLLAVNASKHWIAQGRTLAVIAALVGVVGTALQAWLTGAPWTGVIATAVLGLVHLLDAGPAAPPAPAAGR